MKTIIGSGGGGGGGCFLGHTLVQTPDGPRAIETLQPGDLVVSFDDQGQLHHAKVLKVHVHEGERVVRYSLWGGAVLDATPNHWVLNQFNAFVEIGSLGSDDCLVDENDHLRPIVERTEFCTGTVYNLTVEGHHTFIAGGIRVHNAGLGLGIAGAGGGGGGGKGGGGGARTPTEAADSLSSTQYANLIDLISEGEIEGLKDGPRSVFIENTPLANAAIAATYSQTGNTITITSNQHGLATGAAIYLTFTSGLAVTGSYLIQTTATNTFTVQAINSTTTSGSASWSTFNFSNFAITTREGTQAQSAIPTADGTEDEKAVGVTVQQATPVVRSITDINVDAVRVTITVPALQQFTDEGDINGTSVQLQIAVQYNGGGYTTVINDTIQGRTPDQYQRDYLINLSGAFPVDIRVTRVTADSASAKLVNAFSWSTYTEIVYAKLRYPNSALIAARFDAEQFNSIPRRSYLIRGIKVAIPSNATVDSTTGRLIYAGLWNGTFGAAQWTTDPAWCLWDLLTSTRYGFGNHIQAAQLDKWAFYSASTYASTLVDDGFGGQEPRFSCNINIQTAEDAYKLINDMCSVFRAMPYWSTGALTISQDKPGDSAYLFTLANVSEEGFSYSGSSLKIRPNVAVVSYLDLNTRDIAYEVVEDTASIAKYGAVTTEVSAFACTSRGQASRIGEWLLYSEQYEGNVVSFKASIDAGVLVRPGQVIDISDPVIAGQRRGGRISAATTTTVTVDNASGLSAGNNRTLSVILPDGTVETRNVSSISGTVVTVASAFTTAPNANSVWIYQTDDIQTSQWRVISVQEEDGTTYAISAISYNASKYAYIESGKSLQVRDTTNLNVTPAAPTNFSATEELYTYQAEVRAKVIASWQPVVGVSQYEVHWRKSSNNWQIVNVDGPDYEVLNITPGVFEFKIYSLNAALKPSTTALTGSISALGKTAPPSGVVNLNFIADKDLGVLLSWDAIPDLDIDTYEIRQGVSWGSATVVTKVKATTYKLGYLDDGTYTYQIKALDTSGVYSTNAATIAVTVAGANATTISSSIQATDLVLSWVVPTASTYNIAYYRVTYGGSYGTSIELAKTQSTTFTVPISWTGARTFWVAPVDLVGKFTDPPDSEIVTITGAAAPTITTSVGGNTATLSWTAVAGTLPTAGYEIRQGTTFGTATVLANITGTSYTLKAAWSGSQTFWVVAKDANDNYGTQASAVITVNAAGTPSLASTFAGQNVVFNWAAIKGTLDTEFYLLKRGATYGAATTVATIKGTAYTLKVDWSGTQKFWLAAVDVNGTEGTPDDLDVIVTVPTAPTISQQVIDNNVLLRWNDVTQTLPILNYELRRGATWAGGTVIGTKQGGFTTVFETAAGTYTYWLAGIDSAGNYGTEGSVSAIVNQPPDYVLQLNQNSIWAGDETNIYTDSLLGQIVNVNTTETWQSHFTSRSWTTPQDQITAGYTYYLMPSTTTAVYEEEFDYGTVLAGTKVSAALTSTNVVGTTTITPTIRVRGITSTAATYSQTTTTITVTSTAHGLLAGDYVYLDFTTGTATDGTYVVATAAANTFTVTAASATTSGNVSWIKWTTYANASEVFVTQFRYFRVRYDFASVGGNDLMLLTALNVRLDSKLRNDAGSGTANSGDTGGTTVTFNVAFVDVQSIAVTPLATTGVIAVYDFVDAPNPTSFKVLLFNTSGTRVSGGFSWSARGV
jgi:predicted phage tail protein